MVDSNEAQRRVVCAFLRERGCVVQECETEDGVVAMLEDDPSIEVVVVSLDQAPDLQVLMVERLRQEGWETPVIFIAETVSPLMVTRIVRTGTEDLILRGAPEQFLESLFSSMQRAGEVHRNRLQEKLQQERTTMLLDLNQELNEIIRSQLQVGTISREVLKTISRSLKIEHVVRTVREGISEVLGLSDILWYRFNRERDEFLLCDDRGNEFPDGSLRGGADFFNRIWDAVDNAFPVKVSLDDIRETECPGGPKGRFYVSPLISLRDDKNPTGARPIRDLVREGVFTLHGVLLVLDSEESNMNEMDKMEILSSFSTQAAIAIQNCNYYEMKEAENQRLRDLDNLKSKFLASVSHELRTPLTSIREFSSILLEGVAGKIDEGQREILEIIRTNAEHLYWIIENLLDVSRIEAGKFAIELSRSSLPELVDSVVSTIRPHAEKRRIAVGAVVSGEIPEFLFDKHRIRQVLINLINNAIKFTPCGGRIDVEVSPVWHPETGVEVKVRDTGAGIPKDKIKRIFERFYRLGNEAQSSLTGTGLGLSIVKEIIDAHGGALSVSSELGKGSCFTFRLLETPKGRIDGERRAESSVGTL